MKVDETSVTAGVHEPPARYTHCRSSPSASTSRSLHGARTNSLPYTNAMRAVTGRGSDIRSTFWRHVFKIASMRRRGFSCLSSRRNVSTTAMTLTGLMLASALASTSLIDTSNASKYNLKTCAHSYQSA